MILKTVQIIIFYNYIKEMVKQLKYQQEKQIAHDKNLMFALCFVLFQILNVKGQQFVNMTTTTPNQYVAKINDSHVFLWGTDNILRVYEMITNTATVVANISSLMPAANQLRLMDSISISETGDTIIGGLEMTLCWHQKSKNITQCNTATLPFSVVSLSFTQLDNIVIASMKNLTSYCIVNLDLVQSNKTIKYESLNQMLIKFYLVHSDLRLYGLMINGQVFIFDLRSWSQNYRQPKLTGIPILSGKTANGILGLRGGRYVLISNSAIQIYIHDLTTNSSSLRSFQYSTYIEMFERQQTLIILTYWGTIAEDSKYTHGRVYQSRNALSTYYYCTKQLEISSKRWMMAYQYLGNRITIFLGFVNTMCSTNLSNCLRCTNLNSSNYCHQCNIRYMIDSTYQCVPCSSNCLKCITTTPDGCLSCNAGYIINQTIGCVRICQQGFYFDLIKTQCLSCSDKCRTCDNSQNCNQYRSYYTVNNNGFAEIDISLEVVGHILSFPHIKTLFNCLSLLLLTGDRLWFYQYHELTYESKMVDVFERISYIQNQKLAPSFDLTIIGEWLDNKTKISSHFNFTKYEQYTSSIFYKINRNDGTVLNNLKDYIFSTVPTAIIIFLILRYIFFKTADYKISLYIRQFSFGVTLLLTLVEQNIQYFSFLSFNQMLITFRTNFQMDFMIIFWAFLFSGVVFYVFGFYILCSHCQGKMSKYFLQSCFRQDQSFIWLTFNICLKNFILGYLHSALITSYDVRMLGLISLQLCSIVFSIYIWKKYNCFMIQTSHFIRILSSAIMVVFQLVLVAHYHENDQQLRNLYDQIEFYLIWVLGVTAILYAIAEKVLFNPKFIQKEKEKKKIKDNGKTKINGKNQYQNQNQILARAAEVNQQVKLFGKKKKLKCQLSQIQEQMNSEQSVDNEQDFKLQKILKRDKLIEQPPKKKINELLRQKKNKQIQAQYIQYRIQQKRQQMVRQRLKAQQQQEMNKKLKDQYVIWWHEKEKLKKIRQLQYELQERKKYDFKRNKQQTQNQYIKSNKQRDRKKQQQSQQETKNSNKGQQKQYFGHNQKVISSKKRSDINQNLIVIDNHKEKNKKNKKDLLEQQQIEEYVIGKSKNDKIKSQNNSYQQYLGKQNDKDKKKLQINEQKNNKNKKIKNLNMKNMNNEKIQVVYHEKSELEDFSSDKF